MLINFNREISQPHRSSTSLSREVLQYLSVLRSFNLVQFVISVFERKEGFSMHVCYFKGAATPNLYELGHTYCITEILGSS